MGLISVRGEIPFGSPEYDAASEHKHQCAFIEIMEREFRDYHDLAYAIPNGGKRVGIEKTKLVNEGVKKGIPDLHIPLGTFWDLSKQGVFTFPYPPDGTYRVRFLSLYLEFKDMNRKSAPKPEQVQKIQRLRSFGHAAFVVHGWKQAECCWLWYTGQISEQDCLIRSGLNLAAQLNGDYSFDSWRALL